jgi:hypothetical protein
MRAIRDMNGGKDYDPQWSRAATPRSVFARLIAERFEKATRRIGISAQAPELDATLFRRQEEKQAQLSLF